MPGKRADRAVAIEVRGLCKSFRIATGSPDTLKERFVHPFRAVNYRWLEVLRDISFDVHHGEFFGIVGRNGSGKSTLLKLLASIYRADRGRIRLRGSVSPIIELGVSPRATLGMIAAGRGLALIHGRDYLLPSDIQTVALDVMGHRLGLTFDAVAVDIDPRAVIERILATVPPPQPVWRDGNDGTGRPEFV